MSDSSSLSGKLRLLEPATEPDQVFPDAGLASFRSMLPADAAALCNYLGWSEDLFEYYEARYFQALSALLVANGALARGAQVDRHSFRAVVRAWQSNNGLGNDGIPGEDTLWALHAPVLARDPLGTTRVQADYVSGSGGYDRFTVRADVAGPYKSFYAEIARAGGKVTSAGALRDLNAEVSTGRSATSFHYSGLALDLATTTGMHWSSRGAWKYLISREGERGWRIWVDAPQVPRRTVDAVIWENGALRTQSFTGTYLDLTATAKKYGFSVINQRSSFPGSYLSAEWWHLQYDTALVPGITPFGVELRKVYAERDLVGKPPWNFKKLLYQRLPAGKGWY